MQTAHPYVTDDTEECTYFACSDILQNGATVTLRAELFNKVVIFVLFWVEYTF